MSDSYSIGGGGGKAPGSGTGSGYAFSKYGDVSGDPSPDKMNLINDMLESLFKQLQHASIDITTALNKPVPATWSIVTKSADESGNNNRGAGNNVVADDADLQFGVSSGITYRIRGVLFYEVDEMNTGNTLRHRFAGPGATYVNYMVAYANTSLAFTSRGAQAFDSANQDLKAYTSNAANDQGVAFFDGVLTPSASGTFKFQWVSGSSTAASVTVRKGSYFEYRTV